MTGKDYAILFDLTYDTINAIKKKDLGDNIEKMKGKVVAVTRSKTYVMKLRISLIMLRVL